MARMLANIGGGNRRRDVKGQIGSRFASKRRAFCVKSRGVLRQNATRFDANHGPDLPQNTGLICVKTRGTDYIVSSPSMLQTKAVGTINCRKTCFGAAKWKKNCNFAHD